jgi:hypothetical protein
MSTNLHLYAKREILIVKTGKLDTQSIHYDLYQTPTKVTEKCLKSENILQTYFDYVMSISKDEVEDVYAEDDVFSEKSPIGKKIVNYSVDHIKSLNDFILDITSNGYEIEFVGW